MFQFFAGIDLGSEHHDAHLLTAAAGTSKQLRIQHGAEGLRSLLDWLLQTTGHAAPETVAVALEAPRGAVADALMERGYAVFSINPKQLDRFRDRFSAAGAKDDRRDALVLAHSLRTDQHLFRRADPDDPRLLRLRELSRTEDALRDELRRASNRLWSYLQRYWPALLPFSPAADEPWLWDLLRRTAALPHRAAALRNAQLEQLLTRHHIRRISAAELRDALRHPMPLAAGVDRALAEQVMLLLPRLELLHQQRTAVVHHIEDAIEEMEQDENFSEHRSIEILRSIPGVGRVSIATVLAEGFAPLSHRDYHGLRCLAGMAPVTQQSGKARLVVMRRAYNRRLHHAVYHASGVHAQHDARARQMYARLRARGQSHARAVRGVGDRLLALMCRLLSAGCLYDAGKRGAPDAAAA